MSLAWLRRVFGPREERPVEALRCPRCDAVNPEVSIMPIAGRFRLDDFRREPTIMPSITCRECGGNITLVFTLKEVRI